MASLFRNPTLNGFSHEVDQGRARATGQVETIESLTLDSYYADAEKLVSSLESQYPTAPAPSKASSVTVFLTGATGFLGTFILRDLLDRSPSIKVIAHVRAKTADAGLQRLQDSCRAYGIWNPTWASRLSCFVGELGDPKLWLASGLFMEVAENVDVIIHNGAQVCHFRVIDTQQADQSRCIGSNRMRLCAVLIRWLLLSASSFVLLVKQRVLLSLAQPVCLILKSTH